VSNVRLKAVKSVPLNQDGVNKVVKAQIWDTGLFLYYIITVKTTSKRRSSTASWTGAI